MSKAMYLEVVTPEKNLFAGDIKIIQVPGSKGSFGILKNHAPIISTLEEGTITIITASGEEIHIDIEGGIIECAKNKVIVLAENS